VEPGPLPPLSLQFAEDITVLAVATANKGCIDKTLSALIAAYEVEEEMDNEALLYSGIDEKTNAMIKEKMTTIAL
jgi:hypothetical protein